MLTVFYVLTESCFVTSPYIYTGFLMVVPCLCMPVHFLFLSMYLEK